VKTSVDGGWQWHTGRTRPRGEYWLVALEGLLAEVGIAAVVLGIVLLF